MLETAAMGGTYEFTRFASANLREKDDAYNTAIGGFLAGSVLGLKCRTLLQICDVHLCWYNIVGTTPSVLGFGVLTGVMLAAYDYTGANLRGYKKDADLDEFERKQAIRKNRRRPIEETISEIGEGRGEWSQRHQGSRLIQHPGIKAPGYDERRAERLKEKYGIEVTKAW